MSLQVVSEGKSDFVLVAVPSKPVGAKQAVKLPADAPAPAACLFSALNKGESVTSGLITGRFWSG